MHQALSDTTDTSSNGCAWLSLCIKLWSLPNLICLVFDFIYIMFVKIASNPFFSHLNVKYVDLHTGKNTEQKINPTCTLLTM